MLEKPTILIAGVTGSIGGAAALALVQRGARVVLLGRRAEKLNARADRIIGVHGDAGADDVAPLVVDFSDMESVRSAAGDRVQQNQDVQQVDRR